MNRNTFWALACIVAMIACGEPSEDGAAQGPESPQTQQGEMSSGHGPSSPLSDLPPTRVVLYRNGVGYVERQGAVDGQVMHLRVRPDQINDILKSLTIQDSSGGKAVSIALPVQKTASRLMKELPDAIRNPAGLKALMSVLRGAHVTVDGHDGPTDARIVGIEKAAQPGPDGKIVEAWQITLLTEQGALVPMDMSEVRGLVIKDKTLFAGLEQSLNISLDDGDWKPVELTINLTEGSHELLVSYIVEMPLWKPTYRLVTGNDGQALLQGWAIVDNVTGEDWVDVQLSLVTGEPLSFTYDLHSPKFRPRPDLTPRHMAAATAPPAMESARKYKKSTRSRSSRPPPAAKPRSSLWGRSGASAPMESAAMDMAEEEDEGFDRNTLRDSVQTMVSGTEVGALFQYDIESPVTVPDRSAALVSIVTQEVPGNDVHLFQPVSGSFVNLVPYRSIHFQNTTGFTLEAGPVALHRGSTFVGEGMMSRISGDSNQFIPYAKDNQVTLEASQQEKEEAVGILRVLNGVITSQLRRITAVTYTVTNARNEPTLAYVRRPKRAGWTVRTPSEGVLESGNWWYIPIQAEGNTKTVVTVEEATPVEKRVNIHSNLSGELLNIYLGSHEIDPALQKSLNKILKVKKRLTTISTDMDHITAKKARWENTQRRIRANLQRLNEADGNTRLKRDQNRKLSEADNEISALVAKLIKLDDERARLKGTLTILFEDIDLTADVPKEEPEEASKEEGPGPGEEGRGPEGDGRGPGPDGDDRGPRGEGPGGPGDGPGGPGDGPR